ncbi:MAG: HPr family phosphocarrier protein, partial [Ktedonobacteraceae bacterium]|nr:HPr family phosphocarrier protein [Ktedonobacteraceae bacterium]
MITIDERQIHLQASLTDKQDAIRQAGQLLVNSDCIEAGYIDSMLERELVANTYLGNGIAIPHGLPKDRDLIKRTGISVVQIPAGTPWNPGETARLIVGIAAKSDEHIEVLQRLTRVLGDKNQVDRLTQTKDPRDIIEALTGERPSAPSAGKDTSDYPQFFDAVVINKTGLHARPAAVFMNLAKKFRSSIKVRNGNQVGDGKRLISLLQVGAERGANIRVSAEGPDAADALDALQKALAEGLGDEPEEQPAATSGNDSYNWVPRQASSTISGVSASGGLAIGPTRQYMQQAVVVEDRAGDSTVEGNRFQNALDAAQAELEKLHEEVKARLGSAKAAIFAVHSEFINDSALIQQTVMLIYQGHSAAWSWQQAINERVNQLQKLDDPILAGRAVD